MNTLLLLSHPESFQSAMAEIQSVARYAKPWKNTSLVNIFYKPTENNFAFTQLGSWNFWLLELQHQA